MGRLERQEGNVTGQIECSSKPQIGTEGSAYSSFSSLILQMGTEGFYQPFVVFQLAYTVFIVLQDDAKKAYIEFVKQMMEKHGTRE